MARRKQKSCHECRTRHLKCDGELPCSHCKRSSRQCSKDSDHVILNGSNMGIVRRRKKYDLSFDSSQMWMDIPPSVTFTNSSSNIGSSHSGSGTSTPSNSARCSGRGSLTPALDEQEVHYSIPRSQPLECGIFQLLTPDFREQSFEPLEDPSSWIPDLSLGSPVSSPSQWPSCDLQEALLMQHFVSDLAPWFDVVDFTNHFATTIPELARTSPPLLNAIFALSSRHLYATGKLDESVSLRYTDACYEALVPYIHQKAYDADFLATVLILRLTMHMTEGPEIENSHVRCLGRNIFAAAWKANKSSDLHASLYFDSLRLYISVGWADRRCLFGLDETDESWMIPAYTALNNQSRVQNYTILLLTARCVNYTFGSEPKTWDRWLRLKQESDTWQYCKPQYFTPIFSEEQVVGNPFPKRTFASPSYASAYQYFALGRLLLFNNQPSTPLPPAMYATRLSQAQIDHESLLILRKVLGTSFTYPECHAVLCKAIPAITYSGRLLRDRLSQELAYRLLEQAQRECYHAVQPATFNGLRHDWGWDMEGPMNGIL